MESLEHERANISSSNCNKILMLGKYAFFIMYNGGMSAFVSSFS